MTCLRIEVEREVLSEGLGIVPYPEVGQQLGEHGEPLPRTRQVDRRLIHTRNSTASEIRCFTTILSSPPIKGDVARLPTYPQVLVPLMNSQRVLPQKGHDVLCLLAHWAAGHLPRRGGGSRTAAHRGRARRLRTERASEEVCHDTCTMEAFYTCHGRKPVISVRPLAGD